LFQQNNVLERLWNTNINHCAIILVWK